MSVNGYELKTPAECGYADTDKNGSLVTMLLLHDSMLVLYVTSEKVITTGMSNLVPLPKPPVTRPFTMDELRKLRDERGGVLWFRSKKTGDEFMLTSLFADGVAIGGAWRGWKDIYDNFHLLTNGQPGVAGVGE